MFEENITPKIQGHLRIYEKETNKLLLDKHNDIHPENFSIALAYSLSNQGNYINELALGNGGVRVNASNEYLYSSAQTIGRSSSLYNETYYKTVSNSSANTNTSNNYITVSHVTGNVYSDILVRCTLEKNEPEGQNVSDGTSVISEYSFSEVGLRTEQGDLITHLCFAPITKQSNITLVFDYLIRIQIV